MQSGKYQVAGLSGCNSSRHRLWITHLANHHNIGILTEDTMESCGEIWRIDLHLALIDNGFLGFEDVFNRIFDGNDMLKPRKVDSFYHGGERGRFPHPDRANN